MVLPQDYEEDLSSPSETYIDLSSPSMREKD